MLTSRLFLGLLGISLASAAPSPSEDAAKADSTFGPDVIFQPKQGQNIMYGRQTQLSDGTLLATASYSGSGGLPYFPIYRSTNGGVSWEWISNMTDQVNGLGMSAQPALSVLPWKLGGYDEGTVLASGNSWGPSSTNIDLYASKDKGETWEFVSNVARGSGPNTENGNPCIWEPFILPFNNTLGVFYSDQRDPLHAQKLAHQESTDMKTWGPVINDVAYPKYTARPGMTVIDYIATMKKWIFVHEFPGGDSWTGVGYPVYYRLSDSPFEFRYAYGIPIVANGVQPNASPYVVWTPIGGCNGTIIVSDADHSSVFTNRYGGRPDKWEEHATPEPDAYSRSLHIMNGNPNHLFLLGGSTYGATNVVPLTDSVVDIKKMLKEPANN